METDTLAPDMIDADTAGRRAPRQLGHHISGGVATADADADAACLVWDGIRDA